MTEPRHTASSINDDALSALYDERDEAVKTVAYFDAQSKRRKTRAEQAEAARDQLAAQVDQLTARLGQYADRAIANGEDTKRAEAALDRVRALANEHPVGIDTALIHAALGTTAAAPTA